MSNILQVVQDYWSKAFNWVAAHPKSTIVIAAAVIVAAAAIR